MYIQLLFVFWKTQNEEDVLYKIGFSVVIIIIMGVLGTVPVLWPADLVCPPDMLPPKELGNFNEAQKFFRD